MTENERLTEKTAGCFGYDLKNLIHKTGEFADYNAFYSYNMAVKRLGEYEEIGTVEEFKELKEKNMSVVPNYQLDANGKRIHKCGKCGSFVIERYCAKCGTKVNWIDWQ